MDELKTLKFVTETPKKAKAKRRYTKKKKVAENEDKQTIEEYSVSSLDDKNIEAPLYEAKDVEEAEIIKPKEENK